MNSSFLKRLFIFFLIFSFGFSVFLSQRAKFVQAQTLPAKWSTTFELGLADGPGGAASLRKVTNLKFRYQYLSAGVNTGNGWATWNPNGDFAKFYIEDSVNNGFTPVFTYYMIFQSLPGNTQGESDGVRNNLNNVSTMAAYFNDLKLFFQKAGAFPNNQVVLHVEPDMWGYVQSVSNDNAASVPAKVGASGVADVSGLPDNVAGVAQAVKKLRDTYAPNVLLGYHISVWGTKVDIGLSDPTDAEVANLGTKAVNFYKSLNTNFDIAFAEFSDRDSVYHQTVNGKGAQAWWNKDDFRRMAIFLQKFSSQTQKRIVMWQIPLGNTKMRAMNNTNKHYQDNRAEWFLDDPNSRANIQEYINAGVVAFLFGGGSSDVTCACDAAKDGVTNPNAINFTNTNSYPVSNNIISSQAFAVGTAPVLNGTTLSTPYAADDDGGYFKWKAVEYYKKGTISLNASPITVVPTLTPIKTVTPTTVPITLNSKGVHWTLGRWYTEGSGYNMEGMYKDLDLMKAAGITWVKFTLHKGTGTGLYDKLVPALKERNMYWLANIANPNGKTAGTATQRAEYKTWLSMMVNRYKDTGVIKYYEVHNEPNLHYFWNIDENTTDTVAYSNSVKDYVEHLKDGFSAIKASDPNANVLIGGLSQWKDERFVDELIKNNAYQWFDIMAFHPYGKNPDATLAELTTVKSKMALQSQLASKPIWITEYGYTASQGEAGSMEAGSTEVTKAQYLTDSMNKLRAAGITAPMFWYNFNGDNLGTTTTGTGYELVNTNRTTFEAILSPAYAAYKNLWNATPTATPIACAKKNQGDADCNGSIDLSDFDKFRQEFIAYRKNELDITKALANFNNDNSVDLADFELFRQGFISSRK
jgi:hypothetical protein